MKIKNYLKEINDEVLVDKYVNSFSRFFYFIVFTVASPIIDFVRFIFELNEIYLSYSMTFLIIEDVLLAIQFILIPIIYCVKEENIIYIHKICCCKKDITEKLRSESEYKRDNIMVKQLTSNK